MFFLLLDFFFFDIGRRLARDSVNLLSKIMEFGFVVLKTQEKKKRDIADKCLFPEMMTQLLKIIHILFC